MSKGFVNVVYAKSVVVIETGRMTDDQFARVKYVLGETFGALMIKQLPDKRLEVSWFASSYDIPHRLFSRNKPITPERLREIIVEQLENCAESIGYEVVKPRA